MSVLDVVRTLAEQLESKAGRASFVAREVRHVEVGVQRANEAKSTGDFLAAVMWKRLAAEAPLRIAWIVGDDLRADAAGELVVSAESVRDPMPARRCAGAQPGRP